MFHHVFLGILIDFENFYEANSFNKMDIWWYICEYSCYIDCKLIHISINLNIHMRYSKCAFDFFKFLSFDNMDN